MYEEHPVFEKPANEDATIWRYLDFTKFISLLDRRALFFARADKLGDPFEGSYSKGTILRRQVVFADLAQNAREQLSLQLGQLAREMRRFTLINSWHISDYESAAMWKLYLKTDEGVAIRSTFRRLCDSFRQCSEYTIYVGRVKYIDYESEGVPEGFTFNPFLHKRRSFEHEHELRAIIQRLPFEEGKGLDWTTELFEVGEYVPVDADTLVDEVFVSPTAPAWFAELVQSATRKYDLDKEVVQSALAAGPVY